MTERTVVMGIDESEHAENAFNWYVEHLHKQDCTMVLVYCIEPLSMVGEVPSVDFYESMLEESKERAKKLEESFAEKMKEKHVHGKIIALYGSKPGELIVDTANKEKASLIVCGSRGISKFRRTVLGSVSDYVVHHAHCPVAVCKKTQ